MFWRKNQKKVFTRRNLVYRRTLTEIIFRKDFVATLDTIAKLGITEFEGGGGRIDPADYRQAM